jgi:hypothetical protein
MEISRIVCMQCGRTIRDFGMATGLISHGLCAGCADMFAREIDRLMPVPDSVVVRLPPLALTAG